MPPGLPFGFPAIPRLPSDPGYHRSRSQGAGLRFAQVPGHIALIESTLGKHLSLLPPALSAALAALKQPPAVDVD